MNTGGGKGYISEAMNAVMNYAVKELKIKECIAVHAKENVVSGRVIEKLGFVYEKDVPYECSGGEIKTIGKYYRYSAPS
jgi:ribosomal-protein-alanine N-acetyltransferase